MINGDVTEFIDTLYTGQDLEVLFRGKHYFIQGYYRDHGTPDQLAHMEMFDYNNMKDLDDYIWVKEGKSLSELAVEFLQAKVWDGMAFDEAEREIEWVG